MSATITTPRTILYSRVSTTRQALDGHGLAARQDALTIYAQREGLSVVEHVVDGGQSGASMDRPEWARRSVCSTTPATSSS